jgi:serine/threonine-protein kinase
MTETSPEQRYREAKAIATEILSGDASERAELLRRRCGADPALRREVEWLLEAAEDDSDDEVPDSFQAAARSALQNVSLEVPLPRNYRLVERIGQGGTGIVYLAERVDGDLRQPVAFKLLHFDKAHNEQLAEHFAAERGILSRLDHPRIARLVDGGLTGEGRPFLATEFVQGERIDRWAAENRSVNERLGLFIKVCDALDYAHRQMVVHGDLKPANILVTSGGEPKLLDFGVSRLIETEEGAGDTGSAGLTPAYASPEQLRGERLSAASDVYSMGVLLEELMTGRAPCQPSAQCPPRPLSGLPADLRAVIERATDPQAAARYESARSLAEDVRRFLAFRPVHARNGGVLYRAGRFARRNRAGLALSLLALVVLAAYLVDREAQLERIAWERDRAEAVTEFMSELLSGADSLPTRGNDVTVREILDLGSRQLAESRHDNPAALGRMYLVLGEAYNALGLGEQAVPLLENANRVLSDQLPGAERALVQAELGAAYDSAGRAAEAIAADQRAIDLLSGSPGEHESELMRLRIRQLRNRANVLDRTPQAVIEELDSIIADLEDSPARESELMFEARAALVGARVSAGQAGAALADAERARELAESLYEAGDPRRLRGRYVHATALMLSDPAAAVSMYETLIDDHERLVGPSQRLANTIGNLGVALSRLGRDRESLAAFERAAAMIERSVGRDHYLYGLSVTNLAALHLRVGEPAEAERLVRDILPGLERRHDEVGGVETFYRASALEVLGGALAVQDKLEAAAGSYRQALETLGSDPAESWDGLRERIAGKLAEIDRELGRS